MSDRLDWILETPDATALAARYDEWAESYDDDHDQWGWRGPQITAEAIMRWAEAGVPNDLVVDAGCGTGRLGQELRSAGWTGTLIGLDLSDGMLRVADRLGAYDALERGSVLDLPIPDGCAAITASTGVFTHGHVGGEGFAELARVTAPGGIVAMTQRADLVEPFAPFDAALVAEGRWQPIERTTPENFHPERGDTMQQIVCWRITNLRRRG